MTDDQLNTAAFVFQDTISDWQLVKFEFDNVCAVSKSGEIHRFSSREDAADFVKRCAARALIKFYHAEMAKAETRAD